MKSMKWFGLVAAVAFPLLSGYAQAPAEGAAQISPDTAEVVKLAGSGVGDEVVLAYIQNSSGTFNLSADNLLYLRDLGVSQPVITAMLNHDNGQRGQAQESPPQQQYAPAPASEAPMPAQAPAPTPAQFSTQPAPPPGQAVGPAPTYVGSPPADVSYFYNDLAPYGSWVSLPGVGWCWQPTVVGINRGWRPYCDNGHWVYTDAGWFWQSDYSWGWAPFHYGRWYMDARCGWVWTPGRVWGPAWVTWRTAGTTCGWAPLPPGADFAVGLGWRYNGATVGASFDFGLGINAFAFVSFGNFCANNVSYHCLPRSQATVIYRQTTIVNNYTVVNNTYVNHGIAVNRIAAASRNPVPRASLREPPGGGFGKPPGANGAVVYRSQLKAPEKPMRMVAQKVDQGHPAIQHNSFATMKPDQKPSPVGRGPASGSQRGPSTEFKAKQKPASGGSGSTSTFQRNSTGPAKFETKPSTGSSFSTPAGGASGNPGSQRAPSTEFKANQKPATGGSGSTSTFQRNPTGPAKFETKPSTGSSFSTPAGGASGNPAAGAKPTRQWEAPAKTGSSPQSSSAPKTYQTDQLKQGVRSPYGTKPDTAMTPYSSGASTKMQSAPSSARSFGGTSQGQPTVRQTTPQTQNPRVNSPKSEQTYPNRSVSQQPKPTSSMTPGSSLESQSRKNQ